MYRNMHSKNMHSKKSRFSLQNIVYWTTGILLVFTMTSLWLLCGLYARYVVSGDASDSAHVAKGLPTVDVWEHEAVEVTSETDEKGNAVGRGYYKLLLPDEDDGEADGEENLVKNNSYKKVLPGVDIPKDPFVRLTGTTEVDFELYIEITEKNFPKYTAKAEDKSDDGDGDGEENGEEELNGLDDGDPDDDAGENDAPATEEKNAVTWKIDKEKWKFIKKEDKDSDTVVYTYKCTTYFDAGTYDKSNTDIPILLKQKGFDGGDYELIVSEHFDVSKASDFSLTFTAWIEQVD